MSTDTRYSIARTDESPFRFEEANNKASLGDLLLKGIFDHGIAGLDATFVERIAQHAADLSDLIVYAAESDEPPSDLIARVALHCHYWLRLAPEIQKRVEEAEGTRERWVSALKRSASEIYVVPLDDSGDPDFTRAMLADDDTMAAAGWVWRDNVASGIRAILGARNSDGRLEIKNTREPMDSGVHPAASEVAEVAR